MRYLGLTVVGIVLVATCAGFSSRFNKLGAMGKLPVDGKNGRRGFNPPEGGNPTAPRTLHELSEIDERRGRLEAVKHHSLHPPYLTGGADKLRFWDFGQDTVVADRYIRLTPESGGRHGYLFNTYKNDLHAWEAIFGVFVYSKRTLGADGIAFWYRDKISSEVGGVMLGATPDFAGVGVLFDTYDNDNRRDNPRVQIVYKPKTGPLAKREFKNDNDFVPDLDSTGTDENSIDDYGCSFNFRNFYDMDLIVGKLTYLSHEKTLTLTLRHSTGSDEVPCAKLKGIELPTGYHFGFTAQTGGLADNHDVGFLHVSPISTLEEDAVIDHKLKELEEMDKPHADGFHHDSEKADRQYWRDRSNEDERMKEMYDKQALEARQRNAVAEAKKADRAIQKTELEIKKRDIVTKRIKDTVETNNPYRATRPPDTKPEGFRVRTLEEHHAIHKQMKADGSNPHQLPPHVPPPTNMAPNEELEEYRRTKGESAAHHHHGGHSPDEVPENERRFWNKELPPRDANGNLQRWPETVPKKAPEAPDAPVAADPLDSSSSSDSQPQGESHAQGEVSEAEQRSAEDEARAAAEAHAAELAQLEAEHRARQEAEAADAAAQAEVERHQAHIEAEQQREQQEQQPEGAQGDASQANDNNAAPPDAQQASEEQTPPPNPQPSPPTQKPKRQASVHHDPPVEADPNSVPKASEEHVERELAHGLDFAEMQERRRKRQQARFSAVQGNQAVKPKAPHEPKAEQGPHHPAPTPRTKK